jgi:hypothetical protein
MATRSAIGIEQKNGTVKAIYCHWAGAPRDNGKTLYNHYSSVELNKLISLGSLSVLGSKIVPEADAPHTFDAPQKDVCVFYKRDRGEDTTWSRYDNVDEYVESFTESWCEWFYLYKVSDHTWYVRTVNTEWKLLKDHI